MLLNNISITIKAMVDIAFVWILAYAILKNLKNNVKMVFLLKGIIILLIVKIISDYFDLRTTGVILEYILTWGVLALIIIFQPEIRNGLEQLGKKQIITRHRSLTLDEREKVVYEIIRKTIVPRYKSFIYHLKDSKIERTSNKIENAFQKNHASIEKKDF